MLPREKKCVYKREVCIQDIRRKKKMTYIPGFHFGDIAKKCK